MIMMISCKQATELLSAALERELGMGDRVKLRLHLSVCVGCRRTQAQFDFLRDAFRKHPAKP